MRLLFIDSPACAYDTTTFLTMPLGGTQSAVSGLAKVLAQNGHQVSVINGVAEPRETDGVRFMHLPCPTATLNDCDVIVTVSAPIAKALRSVGCDRPLVLWTHHAIDQPAIQPLNDAEERDLFAGYAFVSEWQSRTYQTHFGIDPAKSKVLRNAVSPAFLQSNPALRWITTGSPPVLGYSSTPYRGLDILLLSFASIRRHIEDATLRIFSSMGIYGPDVPDEYAAFYDMAHALPGVTYVGPLPQPQLAQELAVIDIWAYPSTFAETSCIAAMEAMASGNLLVSTQLGALPETTAGFGHLLDLSDAIVSGARATRFAAHMAQSVNLARADAEATETSLRNQIDYARTHYNWQVRAQEWLAWLSDLI